MKGIIAVAIKEMVCDKFGQEKWRDAKVLAGMDSDDEIRPRGNFNDGTLVKLLESLTVVLGISHRLILDLFGEYWIGIYGKKAYPEFYDGPKNSEEFLTRLNSIHQRVTEDMSDAKPPLFEYEWRHNKRLIMFYRSERGMIDLMVALVKGVGTYFNEELQVTKHLDDRVEVLFPSAQ